MEAGYAHRSSPLSFVSGRNVQKFVHKDTDLHRAGLKTILPAKASYSAAFQCKYCQILVVNYGRAISVKEAKAEAGSR